MKICVTHLQTYGVKAVVAGAALALLTGPALAKDDDDENRAVAEESVNARDVGMTPISDLNLKKDPIPPLLLEAQQEPYTIVGLQYCRHYQAAVADLDAVLGPDYDLAAQGDRKISAGRVAQSVVGSFIPFRGVIREVSGANKHQREFQDAIMAGVMRRSFLKGMGLKLGCKYPARPAGNAERAAYQAKLEAQEQDN